MQVQGTRSSWSSMLMKENVTQKSGLQMYDYYTGMFQAGHSIVRQHGLKGLYAGYYSILYSFHNALCTYLFVSEITYFIWSL